MTGEGRVALGGGRVVVARGDEEQDFEDVGTRDDEEGGIEEDKVRQKFTRTLVPETRQLTDWSPQPSLRH